MSKFDELLARIPQIGLEHHAATILENSRRNAPLVQQTIREVVVGSGPCLIISAGPSLYRRNILQRLRDSRGVHSALSLVATDGAYIQCLKAGITPDWVVTIDPHPTRIVRWFGDPDYERNSHGDDYFKRQDLDLSFRENDRAANAANLAMVDAWKVPLVIGSAAPRNVVARTTQFERYWFTPLVDDPLEDGITKAICSATGCPALNTGGTVGTAAWAFAYSILGVKDIAVVGMDFGYYLDTPLEQTQSWHMLKGDPAMYPIRRGHWDEHYTDPTYAWYLQNFLDLLEAADARIVNCSEAGLLQGERVDCMSLEEWLKSCS